MLDSPVQYIKGVGPKTAQVLAKGGIRTVEDALFFVPRDYEDRRVITPINEVQVDQWVTVLAELVDFQHRGRGRFQTLQAVIRDTTGRLKLSWFHAYPGIEKELIVGERYFFYGQIKLYKQVSMMSHPEFEKAEFSETGTPKASSNFGRILPVYVETGGMHQKALRKIVREAIKMALPDLKDTLPADILKKLNLPQLRDSFLDVHYPKEINEEKISASLKRLIFEEFFVLQLGLSIKKQKNLEKKSYVISTEGLETFIKSLPFELTNDQVKTIESLKRDFQSGKPMSRLIQGDVGSGKTVVALAAAYLCAKAGLQCAFMAPTEILALQHYNLSKEWLGKLGISVGLLTHSSKANPQDFQMVCGTHALFQKSVEFQKLGLVIVDEQHRFGVEQRTELIRKNSTLQPHLLMMSATPIPRTLALTLYGDLDLSLIQEKPKNRIPIVTKIIREKRREEAYDKIRDKMILGEQVYVIYPLIEESEKIDLKSATQMFEHLKADIFPGFKLALLHGRMKSDEKNQVLADFKAHLYDLLVSTTVIEVGIDIPNATLMVIEHPERLGLSQLHQLRGRVGRGTLKSECLLLSKDYVSQRLRILEQSENGFEIAEEDLKIRGPGEFLGLRQSGLPGFKVGNLVRDGELLQMAKETVDEILTNRPDFKIEKRWQVQFNRLSS